MVVVNLAIIYKFMVAKWKSKQGGIESTNQSLNKAAMKGTTMLITVSVTFIILTGLTAVMYVVSPQGKGYPIVRLIMNI